MSNDREEKVMFFHANWTPHEIALPLRVVFLFNKPYWFVCLHVLIFMVQFGRPSPAESPVREQLASYAHNAWSDWMKYLFQKSFHDLVDGTVTIPAPLVARWKRQMNTPYTELPEEEKESDRLEADRMLEILDA